MATALAGETMAMAISSPGYIHVSLASSTSSASSLSMAGWSHRRTRSASMLVAVGLGSGKLGAGRRATGSSGASSLVCRSSVSPLSDANGNVAVFQSEEEFNTILNDAGDKLVVVDISTTTCGPCKMIFPKFVEMSLAYPDAVFLKINGDSSAESRALMRKWGVRAVPNFRFFKNGEQVHSHTGAKVDELKTRFAEHYGQSIKV
ncbi:hypothetical protein M758_7G186500 [Ceratodon purpureus]|uniref:Thioredoxin domain-containing protein n=1 Tax=Ceratodon purpureus TaxID=3225 RepID=A0A8T0HB63_CERPU|nr:hypothetical protein KC19_7G189800 [Ceratodon purpureus]KAG0612050.1 hypothetical protein M758_7G186500 [Ceratodon purpureus]